MDSETHQRLLDEGLAERLRGLREAVERQLGKPVTTVTAVVAEPTRGPAAESEAETATGVGKDEEGALIALLDCECGERAFTCDTGGNPLCDDCASYAIDDAMLFGEASS